MTDGIHNFDAPPARGRPIESPEDMIAERLAEERLEAASYPGYAVPGDDPSFLAFMDEVWNRRPSSLVRLGGFANTPTLMGLGSFGIFDCRFLLDEIPVLVHGRIVLTGRDLVRSVSNVRINREIADSKGKPLVVPLFDADLPSVFAKLTEVFLDRTPNPGQAMIGELILPTPAEDDAFLP